ncbi:MAG: TolC family protein [Vicinamibacterales bacterium]
MHARTTLAVLAAAGLLAPAPTYAQSRAVPSKLTVEEALRVAEAANPLVAAARESVAIARGELTAASRRPNPELSVSSEGYRPGAGGGTAFVDQQELVIRLDQEIETAGKRRLRTRSADLEVKMAQAEVDDQVRRLRLEVGRTYYQAVLAETDAALARAALQDIDRVIAVVETRFELGEASGGELRRLQVERLRFADDVLSAELTGRKARSALLALMGAVTDGQPFELATPLAPDGPLAPDVLSLDDLRATAIENRPDVRAARREEERAANEAQLQRALRTPSLTAGAGYRRSFGDDGIVFGIGVPLPLFGRNPGGLARAEAEKRRAAYRLAAIENEVALEVANVLADLELARSRLAYLQGEYLENARQARDSVTAAYRSGAADLIDYLDAERSFRDSRRTLNRALYDYRVTLFELEAAIASTVPLPGQSKGRQP